MKKVCIVTATRAEYGLLKPVIQRIRDDSGLRLLLIATGTHLEQKYGYTYNEILSDGIYPDYAIPIISGSDESGILNNIGNAVTKVGGVFISERPDVVVLLGDRYETLAFAMAAVSVGIPVAHINGGEATEGAVDDLYRNAITKLSHIHFPSTEVYRQRIIQMGENPKCVFNVGSLGVENIRSIKLLEKAEIEQRLGFGLDGALLVTYHSVTTQTDDAARQIEELLAALEERPQYRVLFTRPNADLGRELINDRISSFVMKHAHRSLAVNSLGVFNYLSVMRYCAGVVGNSSSGIIEAPSMHVGTVNVGDRQKGRVSAASVIHCHWDRKSILNALDIMSSSVFHAELEKVINPYEADATSQKIVGGIAEYLLHTKGLAKPFNDLHVQEVCHDEQ